MKHTTETWLGIRPAVWDVCQPAELPDILVEREMNQLQCPVCGAISNQERIFEDRVIYKTTRTGSRRSEVQKIVYWHCLNCGRDYSSTVCDDGSIHRPFVEAPSGKLIIGQVSEDNNEQKTRKR